MPGNNQLDKVATEASDGSTEAFVASLWDRTFTSFAPEMVVKMPYYFQNHISSATGITSPNQFKVNSLYDFDLTGVGHQPKGRDTWASIYDYYKVLETRVHVTHVSTQYVTGTVAQTVAGTLTDANAGSGYLAPAYVGGLLDITANPPSNLTSWQEATQITNNHQQKFTDIQRFERIGSRKNTTVHYSMTWTADMFDTAIINQASQNTWTPVGSDPQNLNYFTPIIFNSNSANNALIYSFECKAEMLVAFKVVNRSLLLSTD